MMFLRSESIRWFQNTLFVNFAAPIKRLGWIGEVSKLFEASKIFTHFIPYKNTPGHPSAKEQQTMADDLTAFIEQNIKW